MSKHYKSQYDVTMPCFNCMYGHNCKYYSNLLWDWWILNNNKCPAFTYPFDSLYKAILYENENKNAESEGHLIPVTFGGGKVQTVSTM